MKLSFYIFFLASLLFIVNAVPLSVPLRRDLEQPIQELEARTYLAESILAPVDIGVGEDEHDDEFYDRALDEALLNLHARDAMQPGLLGLFVRAGVSVGRKIAGVCE